MPTRDQIQQELAKLGAQDVLRRRYLKVPAKKGNVVLVSPWARNGLELGDDTVLTDGYCVMAVVAS